MTFTLLNPSATDYGRSADNVLSQMLSTGATLALVRDSSKLTAMCASVGMRVIFRAAGDDPAGDPVGRNDPAGFVNSRVDAAPQATWIHGTNEVGFSAQLDVYTRELARAAEARGKRIVAYNAATNQDLRQWKASEPTIRWLMERGHKIGVHLYLDGSPEHDAGGYAPLDWLKSIGAPVFVTEYAYIHSIFDANVGYRADMDAGQYTRWHDQHAAKMASYGYPLFHFSLTHWNDDEAGKRVGFGTEDRPEIDAHFAPLNARYPILESVPVPLPPPTTYPPGEYKLARIPGSYVNVRALPNAASADLGDLRVGDKVILTGMASGEWVLLTAPDGKRGWTSLQGGLVVFEPVTAPPAFRLKSPLPGGIITSHFNEPRSYGRHEGTDWALSPVPCAVGTVNALACADGIVDSVRDYPTAVALDKLLVGYGLYVRLKHTVGADTYFSWTCHLSAPSVCVGQRVKQGEPVGILGTTGNSSGYHVHLTVQHIGHGLSNYVVEDVVNPEPLLIS